MCADSRSTQEVVLSDGGRGCCALCAGLVPGRPLLVPWAPHAICILSRVIAGDGLVFVGGLHDDILDVWELGRFAPSGVPASPSSTPSGPRAPRDINRRYRALPCDIPRRSGLCAT